MFVRRSAPPQFSVALGLLAAAFLSSPCKADDAPDATQVSAVVQELANPVAAERAAAARKLRAWGPVVLPLLPVDAALTDPAIREAVQRIRRELERQVAVERVGPSAFDVQVAHESDRPVDNRVLRQLRLRLQAATELRPLFLTVRDADLHARDAGGQWRPFNPQAVREIDFNAAGAAEFDMAWLGEAAEAKGQMQVSGRCEVELIGAVQELRFDQLTSQLPRTVQRGDVRTALTELETDTDSGTLWCSVMLYYAAGGPAFESYRVAAVPQGAWLEFPDGRRHAADKAVEVVREQNGALGLRYRVSSPPDGWQVATWVISVPTLLLRTPVSFEATWTPPDHVDSPR